jgi:hypothetical protein
MNIRLSQPTLQHYREFDNQYGVYEDPIDGWVAVRKASLALCSLIRPNRYSILGGAIKRQLELHEQAALLCTRMHVFHVTGPAYASDFGMLESEIVKYREIGRDDMVARYSNAILPPAAELSAQVVQGLAEASFATARGNQLSTQMALFRRKLS